MKNKRMRSKRGRYVSTEGRIRTYLGVILILLVAVAHIQAATAQAEQKSDTAGQEYVAALAKREALSDQAAQASNTLLDPDKWEAKMLEAQNEAALASLTEAERWIIQKESSFRTTAKNPKSTAFGLWQGILSQRTKYANRFGFDPHTTQAHEQIQMFRAYVDDRYGTVEKAVEFHQLNNWY